jgi:pyruvate,water dikinase
MIRWLESVTASDRDVVGGKAASLGELTGLGLRVPAGFALVTDAYRDCRDDVRLGEQIDGLLVGLDLDDMATVASRCEQVRELIRTMPVEAGVSAAVRLAYEELCARAGVDDVPVAVRSSACGEDSSGASFAGEHDTYLWVRGADAVVAAVRNCWASLFTDRATCYRVEMGFGHDAVAMGVVVQQMVRPRSAGVAFTLNPSNGDRSAIAIDSAWGFGEAVVSGEVTPDSYLLDKVLLTITRRTISVKEHEYVLDSSGTVVTAAIADARATAASLSDDEVIAVAKIAKLIEKHYGCPQDIEWALDADAPVERALTLLQARPETVWSQRSSQADVEPVTDFMSGIVATLVSPLHAGRDR